MLETTEGKELLLAAQMLDEEIKRLCLIRDSLLIKANPFAKKTIKKQRKTNGKWKPI